MNYDYIIIGLNPSGLTLAYYLSKMGKQVLLVDGIQSMNYNKTINNLYTTDPTIYSDSFVNLINLLKKEFNNDFHNLFTPMKFNSDKLFNFENNIFFVEFILLLINENICNLTLKEFIECKNFNSSQNLINHINSICKIMLDKCYNETYLEEFINLMNKELSYKFYQPKEPIHNKLYNIWLENIYKTKKCNILLDSLIGKIINENDIAIKLEINDKQINAKNIIYCIDNKYNESLSLTFHWNNKLDLQNILNLQSSEWELFYIVQSDYTYFNDERCQTVILVKINNVHSRSSYINKNAFECTKEELINETFRQLKEVFINLPNPTNISIINNKNNFQYKNYKNVYVINNNNGYNYIEESIIKSKKLINELEKNSKNILKIYEPDKITDIIKFIFMMNMILYAFNSYKLNHIS